MHTSSFVGVGNPEAHNCKQGEEIEVGIFISTTEINKAKLSHCTYFRSKKL